MRKPTRSLAVAFETLGRCLGPSIGRGRKRMTEVAVENGDGGFDLLVVAVQMVEAVG